MKKQIGKQIAKKRGNAVLRGSRWFLRAKSPSFEGREPLYIGTDNAVKSVRTSNIRPDWPSKLYRGATGALQPERGMKGP